MLANLRSVSIFVLLCNNIPAGKAKRKQILTVAVRENVIGPDLRLDVSLRSRRLEVVGEKSTTSKRLLRRLVRCWPTVQYMFHT